MTTVPDPQALLLDMLCQTESPEEMAQVLDCLLTTKELKDLEGRIQIFALLMQEHPHRAVAQELGVGVATVSRGAQVLKRDAFATVAKHIEKELK